MSITLADAIIRILPDDTELGPGFQKAKGAAQSFATDLSGKVVAATKVAVAGIIGLGAGAVAAGANFVRLGSDAEEMLGKFNVVFATTGGQVTDALTTAQGDAERTSGSWANQMRALASYGLELTPEMEELLTALA